MSKFGVSRKRDKNEKWFWVWPAHPERTEEFDDPARTLKRLSEGAYRV